MLFYFVFNLIEVIGISEVLVVQRFSSRTLWQWLWLLED